jgi:uncharacterized protein YhaN
MRITGLRVDGFGVWSGLELSDLSDQLNVFYGPNEAGKTTLMQFVRSTLYGFSPERRARYLPPVRPGRPGGTVLAVSENKRYAISRHADDAQGAGDTVMVSDELEREQDEHALVPLLGDVDEPTFNNVFAFGLREIQELGTLSDTQAADELYNLALGLDRVSLLDVMRELETSRARLLAADDRPSLVTQLHSQRERLQTEIRDLSQATARYFSLAAERDNLAGEITRLEAEVARYEQQGRELALARALADRWQRRSAIEGQLAGLGQFDRLPQNALARFERLQSRLATWRRRFEKLRGERRAVREQSERLNINAALCRQAPRLEALGEQQQWIASLESQTTDLAAELLQLESQREQGAKRFGIGDKSTPAAAPSKRAWNELRATASKLRLSRQALRQARQQLDAALEAEAAHQRQITTALGSQHRDGLTQALAEAGELVSQLRNRVRLDGRLDQMSRRETELEEQSHECLEQQILPTWLVVGLGGLFVLGCALVLLFLAGLVLPASLGRGLGWPVGFLGVLAAAAAGATKLLLEHSAARQLDNCHSQIHLLGEQIRAAKAERDELDERLPRGGGPLVARLQAAEQALVRLEELLPLEAKREAAQREAAMLGGQVQSLGADCGGLKKRFRQLLAEAGLPAELKPRQLRQYLRRRDEIRALGTTIDEKRAELAGCRGQFQALAGRIAQLAAEVGFAPRAVRPLDQLRECLAELAQQQSRLAERDALSQHSGSLRARQRKIKAQARKLRRRRDLLLHAAGTTDVAEFRRLAESQAEAERLAAEHAQLAQEIAAVLAGRSGEQQVAQWLNAPQNLEQMEIHVADARRIAMGHVNQALERRGEMNQQLKTLLDDRRLAYKRVELGTVEKRLQDAIDRWRVLSVCGMMLEAVRQYYEREHQPPALQEASGYLERLTGGRYRRVWTRLGEQALVVDDGQGRSLKVEVLSRGTREQLFLALRLALVSSFARRGVRLPLVLDDVLVNFDAGRAKAAAVVLRDFARGGNQVLIFTCHEHIARLFKHIKAEVRQLPDNGQSQAATADATIVRPARRPRPEQPALPARQPPQEPALPELAAEIDPEISTTPLPEGPMLPPAEPRTAPRASRRVERVEWSAEEFDGELADRVRRTPQADRESAAREDRSDTDDEDDAEAA